MADANINRVSMTEKQNVKEITNRLEEGLKKLFDSEVFIIIKKPLFINVLFETL